MCEHDVKIPLFSKISFHFHYLSQPLLLPIKINKCTSHLSSLNLIFKSYPIHPPTAPAHIIRINVTFESQTQELDGGEATYTDGGKATRRLCPLHLISHHNYYVVSRTAPTKIYSFLANDKSCLEGGDVGSVCQRGPLSHYHPRSS